MANPIIEEDRSNRLTALLTEKVSVKFDVPLILSAAQLKVKFNLNQLNECGLLSWLHEAVRLHASDLFISDMETGMREQMHTFKQSIQVLIDKKLVDASYINESGDESPVPALTGLDKLNTRL